MTITMMTVMMMKITMMTIITMMTVVTLLVIIIIIICDHHHCNSQTFYIGLNIISQMLQKNCGLCFLLSPMRPSWQRLRLLGETCLSLVWLWLELFTIYVMVCYYESTKPLFNFHLREKTTLKSIWCTALKVQSATIHMLWTAAIVHFTLC